MLKNKICLFLNYSLFNLVQLYFVQFKKVYKNE
jgi:hypothetical protein